MSRGVATVAKAATVAMTAMIAACASPSIEGGTLVARGAEPTGETIGEWRMSACHDLAGVALPDRDGRVRVVKKIDGKVVLVELRDDTDSVVVANVSAIPNEWVFALALAREAGNRYYREYTVPEGGGVGKFIIAKEWTGHDTGDGFGGTYKAASVTCALVPAGPRG